MSATARTWFMPELSMNHEQIESEFRQTYVLSTNRNLDDKKMDICCLSDNDPNLLKRNNQNVPERVSGSYHHECSENEK